MGNTYRTARKQLMQLVESELKETSLRVGASIEADAKKLVPAPGASRGYATGALRAIIHVETPENWEQSYRVAVAAASVASDARILKRSQLQDAVMPKARPLEARAVVAVPLEYADLIERGFEHAISGHYIMGTRYLLSAANDNVEYWKGLIDTLATQMELIRVTTDEDRIASIQAREIRSSAYAARRERTEQWRSFLATIPLEELKSARGTKILSVSKSGRVRYSRENKSETKERLQDMFEEWRALRSTQYKMD